jgi:hypothetical protein
MVCNLLHLLPFPLHISGVAAINVTLDGNMTTHTSGNCTADICDNGLLFDHQGLDSLDSHSMNVTTVSPGLIFDYMIVNDTLSILPPTSPPASTTSTQHK